MEILSINFVDLNESKQQIEETNIDLNKLGEINTLLDVYEYLKKNIRLNRKMKFEDVKTSDDIINSLDFGLANIIIENYKNLLFNISKKTTFDIFKDWVRQFLLYEVPKAFVLINVNISMYDNDTSAISTLYQIHSTYKEYRIYELIGNELNTITLDDIKKIKTANIDPDVKYCFQNWEKNKMRILNFKLSKNDSELEKVSRIFTSAYIIKLWNLYNTMKKKSISLISFTNSRELSKNLFNKGLFKGPSLNSRKKADTPLQVILAKLKLGQPIDYLSLHKKYKETNVFSKYKDSTEHNFEDLSITYIGK